jgi:hypothetical protein
MLITAGQKNKFLLDMLCELYGGSVYIEKKVLNGLFLENRK